MPDLPMYAMHKTAFGTSSIQCIPHLTNNMPRIHIHLQSASNSYQLTASTLFLSHCHYTTHVITSSRGRPAVTMCGFGCQYDVVVTKFDELDMSCLHSAQGLAHETSSRY
jgi:hypothetical protein